MIGLHLVRKLKNGVSGFRGFSALTGSGQSLQTCVIRGSCQDIVLPGALFESLDDHVAQFPLVTKIPHGGVITLQANQPYLINEHWRPIFRSGFLHSSFCQSENDCIANPFDFTNVGVLKGLNLLAFKKFNRVEGKTNSNHLDYCAFVEDVFRRYCLGSNLQHQFPECRHFIDAIINGADEDVLRHHSFFLGDEEAANFFSDNHRLLRQEFKHRGREAKARAILVDLEGCYNNFTVVKNCQNHLPLQYLLGSHSPSKLGHPGSAVVDLHRIAVQHAIEDNVMTPAMQDYPHESYLLNNYQRVDLIRALRYMYPKYGGEALVSFKNHSVLEHLQMARRLPTPTIYNYVSPVSGPKVEP